MKFINALSDWVFTIEKVIAVILCSLILVSLAAGVLFRYVLNSPLTWSDETGIFSLIWLTFIGGSMSIKVKSAPTITILTDWLKGKTRRIALVIGYVALVLFIGYVFYFSIVWLSSPNILVQKSSSMEMPMIYAYLCIPVSFMFMIIHSSDLLLKSFVTKDVEAA